LSPQVLSLGNLSLLLFFLTDDGFSPFRVETAAEVPQNQADSQPDQFLRFPTTHTPTPTTQKLKN
jgi:hypothetical protein